MSDFSFYDSLKSYIPCIILDIFIIIGVYRVLKILVTILLWLKKNVFILSQDLKAKYGNDWVVITGGSDGIGLSFAEQFVKKGHKVCLVARNEAKLKEKISELEKKYEKCTLKYIVYDFDKLYNDEELKQLEIKLSDELNGQVSILLYNAGVCIAKTIKDISYKEIRTVVNVNAMGYVFFTKIILNMMEKRNGKSLVMCTGSTSISILYPGNSLYSGTKAFMKNIHETLQLEYKNVDFTYLIVGPTRTKMVPVEMSFMVDTNDVSEGALKRAGKYMSTTVNITHDILMFLYCNSRIVRFLYKIGVFI